MSAENPTEHTDPHREERYVIHGGGSNIKRAMQDSGFLGFIQGPRERPASPQASPDYTASAVVPAAERPTTAVNPPAEADHAGRHDSSVTIVTGGQVTRYHGDGTVETRTLSDDEQAGHAAVIGLAKRARESLGRAAPADDAPTDPSGVTHIPEVSGANSDVNVRGNNLVIGTVAGGNIHHK